MGRVIRALLLGAATGAVLGTLARALMRLVAIGMTIETQFRVGASLAIVAMFVVSGAGACVARVLDVSTRTRALVVLGSSAPLALMGTAFAIDEIGDVMDLEFTPPWTAELLFLASVILALMLATPYAAWRAAPTERPPVRPAPSETSDEPRVAFRWLMDDPGEPSEPHGGQGTTAASGPSGIESGG
jgi:hypothetical protein